MIPPKTVGARLGGFARHRVTQIVAALIIGLGLGAGGTAIILHGDQDGRGARVGDRFERQHGGLNGAPGFGDGPDRSGPKGGQLAPGNRPGYR